MRGTEVVHICKMFYCFPLREYLFRQLHRYLSKEKLMSTTSHNAIEKVPSKNFFFFCLQQNPHLSNVWKWVPPNKMEKREFSRHAKKKGKKVTNNTLAWTWTYPLSFLKRNLPNAMLKIATPCAELNGRRNKYFAMAICIKRQRFKLKMIRDRWKKLDVAKLDWKIFDS